MKKVTQLFAAIACALIATTFAQEATEPEMEVTEFDWCTITVPKTSNGQEPLAGVITVKGDAIKEDCELRVDFHKFVGENRVPGAGRANPVSLKAGASIEVPVTMNNVPDDASGIAFVVYTMPAGATTFKEATHKASAGVKITR